MSIDIETIIRIALEEFAKVFATASKDKAVSPEVEEVEELPCGNYLVTLGYWSRDSKPGIGGAASKPTKAGLPPIQFDDPLQTTKKTAYNELLNPWRRKYKRVEIDPNKGKAVAIRMYEPALGVS